ncbi:terminase family protein [Kocuria rhizophila]|uniref:hypothetical protein n=1 Tax=Kocuria rhizophila TaxID=72000 RepID=UPI003866616C|nr:terminase family protein [Kocuria rhizophila]WSZ54129.1 terminase family protein [Kocuria rhizophila]
MPTVAYDYEPSPVQAEAHDVVVDELLYGGAAGGGKSRWGRAEAVRMALLVPGSRTILFRRTFADLDRSVVMPLRMEMPPGVATYSTTAHTWTFTNGSVIELAYLKRKDDVLNYQGAEYQLVIWEELTQFTEFPYRYMLTRLRAAGPVKDRMEELGWKPRVIATANPGGPGHFWVRQRWIDPAPPKAVWRPEPEDEDDEPGTRCYMPAKATDNPHIDKSYVKRLKRAGGNLARAMLDGDWDILEGVRFDQWRADTHVITAHQFHDLFRDTDGVPLFGYPRAIGIDYGTRAPFCALWGVKLPNGTVVIYREAYEVGLTPSEQADRILAMEADGERREDRPLPAVMDPSMWKAPDSNPLGIKAVKDHPPVGSVADFYRQRLGNIHKARNDRIGGWALIDEHLRVGEDGLPGLLVVETCRNLIRTLPALPRSDKNPEDLDTEAEDHAADACRYLLQELAGKEYRPKPPASEQLRRDAANRTLTAGVQGVSF